MKINTRNVVLTLLLALSFTSYIFLSTVQVNEPAAGADIELQEEKPGEQSGKIMLPDLTLIQKACDLLQKVL